MNTIKVKPWGEGQGEFVIVNAEDFNPDFHKRYEAEAVKEETVEAPQIAKPEAVKSRGRPKKGTA
jgi:hypothetical protein